MTFEQSLAYGQVGESAIAKWLRARGNYILPAYEKLLDDKKGPALLTPSTSLITPDLFVFNGERALWIEAKRKEAFTWHRKGQCWTTGIDLRHYEDYCHVDDETPWPVWLFFLQEGGYAKDNPAGESPSGLFAATLGYLRQNEHHRHQNFNNGRGGVFWEISAFQHLAKLEEMRRE